MLSANFQPSRMTKRSQCPVNGRTCSPPYRRDRTIFGTPLAEGVRRSSDGGDDFGASCSSFRRYFRPGRSKLSPAQLQGPFIGEIENCLRASLHVFKLSPIT